MAGTRAPFASLAALAAVASAQAEQPGAAAAETAKKDLQALPTVQRPVEGAAGRSLFSGSSAATGLSLGTPAAPGNSQKNKDDAPTRSANWLLDGVNQLEAEAKVQREMTVGKPGEGGSQAGSSMGRERSSSTTTANPFAGYLTQWLSPADQSLLSAGGRNGGSSSTAPWETTRSDFRRDTPAAATPAQTSANPFQLELPGIAELPSNRTAQNPYLADPFEAQGAAFSPVAGNESGGNKTESLPSILTPSQSPLPPVAPVQAPLEQARPAPVAAPTDRLIDDRKYFPQLRRF